MANGPGVDSLIPIKSIISEILAQLFARTSVLIKGIIAYPPPKVNNPILKNTVNNQKELLSILFCSSPTNGLISEKPILIPLLLKTMKATVNVFYSPRSAGCLFPLSRPLTSAISWLPSKGGFMKICASFLIPFSSMLSQTALSPTTPCSLSLLRKPNEITGEP